MNKKLYFIKEVGSITGISTDQVRYITKKYKIPYHILNDRRYFTHDNVKKILLISKEIYHNTKSPKKFLDLEYQLQQLEKKLTVIKKQARSIIDETKI